MSRSFTAASLQSLSCSDAGFPSGTAARTLTCWFKTSTALTSGQEMDFISYGSSGTGNGVVMGVTFGNSTTAAFFSQYGAGIVAGTNVANGQWHFLQIDNRGSSTWDLNVDTFRGSAIFGNGFSLTTNTTLGGTFYVGRSPWGPNYATVEIAEVAIWNILLSGNQTTAVAAGMNPTRVAPLNLLGYWPLWGLQSPEPDLSGNGRSLTLNNAPPQGTSHPPVQAFTRRAA